jgi:flagellar assembly protein FliH
MEARAREAYQRGLQEGEAAGLQKAGERFDAVITRLTQSIAEMSSLRSRLRNEAESDVVQLALAVARRIVSRELSVDPEALLGIVKAALRRVELREVHRLRLHPADRPAIAAALERVGLPQQIQIDGDAALERGAVILETSRGSLDASVNTQLDEIERGFTDLLHRS